MALYKVSEIEKIADQAKTAVIAFNCIDYNTVKPVIDVAEELNCPVICALYPDHALRHHWTNLEGFAAMVISEAQKVKVPIGLHLDHCTDFDYMVKALNVGFSSVMFDGSMLPVEENIILTRQIAKVAHALGASVEAELGHVGFANTVVDQFDQDLFTKPEVAKQFCEESECDAVAIAIGSAHGFYTETPKLDLERLKEINKATDIPLVLHGGSGIPDEQLEIAFREGINKFNVGTEFLWLYRETVRSFEGQDIADMANLVQEALKDYLRKKMMLSKF